MLLTGVESDSTLSIVVLMALALRDAERDFRREFEPLTALTPDSAWHALLMQAGRRVVRPSTPHSGDDFVVFEVSRTDDREVIVALERRIARFTDIGDYDGTAVLGCYLTMRDEGWQDAIADHWSLEGHVSAYEQLDGVDDRPNLEAFRDQVQASRVFLVFRRAEIIHVRLTAF
jgi:hypothetical protein